jgi:endonuclease/exonuclease/phosphatase (EEP) superfamily protein YafD
MVVAALWFAASFVFADGIAPLFRGLTSEKHRSNGTYRIVSLNCAGTADAANEVIAFKPDVVLLQEVPGTNQVAILARHLFGANGCYVSGFDCAIIARCPLTLSRNRDPYYASAVVQLGPVPVLVTSLRLVPPETRSENRQQRMRQLTALMGAVREHAGPQVIGGDFNAPGGDAVFSLLRGYQDTYATAGRGWGHTALNNIPFVRPDQIWVKALRPRSARAVKTVHSDHRMVVGDIELSRL